MAAEHAAMKGEVARRGMIFDTGPRGLLGSRSTNRMTGDMRHQAWKFSPYIRPCVDGIKRIIQGKAWDILPVDGRQVRDLAPAEQVRRTAIKAIFSDPNNDRGSWPTFIGLITFDLLVHDAPAIEKVKGLGTGSIRELVPLYGPSIAIDRDEKGFIRKYVQQIGMGAPVEFGPDELIYAPMYATTRSPYGEPIIETCVDQICYLLLAADHHARILSRNEIPDGIAFISGIAPADWQKFLNDARQNQGKADKLHAIATANPNGKLDWIQFTRSSREEQIVLIMGEAARVIIRNFGIDPTSAGLEQKMGSRSRSEAEIQVTDSGLIEPICTHYEEMFNLQVLTEVQGAEGWAFRFIHDSDRDPEISGKVFDLAVRGGRMTIQEARSAGGLEPYAEAPFANRPFLEVGGGLFFLDTGELITAKVGGASPVEGMISAPPAAGPKRADVLVLHARVKGHHFAPKVEELVQHYRRELKNLFDEFGREAKAVINAGVLNTGTVEFTREERDAKWERIKALRDKYWSFWGDCLGRNAPKAADLGTARAMLKLRHSQLDRDIRAAEIQRLVKKNHEFMREAWRKYADRVAWVLNRATKGMAPKRVKGPGGLDDDVEFDSLLSLEVAEDAALAASVASLDSYAHYMWALENVIYAREADASGMRVHWHLVSGNPCPTCLEVGDQDWDVRDLTVYPGEGTDCDGRCYCFLEII